jgi:ParB family chromosome partitioning protein
MKRKALGKGLDALLPSVPTEGQPARVDVDLLFSNEQQPRMKFSSQLLEELAASIRENGIVQPIVVRPRGSRFEIVAGERRWRAAQLAGLMKVPVVVMVVPDEKMLELALLENIQREDLNPIDEARAYQVLLEEKGVRQEDLARRLGKARSTIANSVRLLNFPESIQNYLENREISVGQVRPLLGLDDVQMQLRMCEQIRKKGWSAREVERQVKRLASTPTPGKAKSTDPHLKTAEERLCRRFGARVRIQQGGKGGQIVIHYTSDDELERLYEELLGK